MKTIVRVNSYSVLPGEISFFQKSRNLFMNCGTNRLLDDSDFKSIGCLNVLSKARGN